MTNPNKPSSIPPKQLRLYQKLLTSILKIEPKENFGAAYTAINGNMYSMISKYGVIGLRLPKRERDEFLAKYNADIFRADPAWPPNKEYVAIPDALLADLTTLRPYLSASFEYAKSLKPKAVARKGRKT
jgi:hypothetical protein